MRHQVSVRMKAPHARQRPCEAGQVLLEFMINFLIFFFLIWSLAMVALISGTKLLTNYASWAAARAWSVNVDSGDGMDEARKAARDVLRAMHWKDLSSGGVQKSEGTYSRPGIVVDYQTTLGIPTFLARTSSSAVRTRGFAPMEQEPIKESDEKGDNK